jgi:hypothetical protein
MDRFVLFRPGIQPGADVPGHFLERHERFVAMLADQAGLAHIPGE